MTELKEGTQIELLNGTLVTIKELKEEITFEKMENGEPVSQTLSVTEFEKLLKPSSEDPKVGLQFKDQDNSQAEILEIANEKILYKKQWGADSWNSSMTVEDFKEKQRNHLITILP